jgi:hypothetical protein
MTKNTLGLAGDGDDVDFVEAVGAAFGIAFGKEPQAWSTLGDVFDTVCRHMQPVPRGQFPCLSASAYRRIKRAILTTRPDLDLRPDTPLRTLIGRDDVSRWWPALERDSGLRLPALSLTKASGLALLALYLGVPGAVVASGLPGWIAFLSPILGFVVARWLPLRPPVRTVEDLARAVAATNARALAQVHGAIRTRDLWSSLVWIARDVSGYKGSIDRDTVLIG